MEAEMSNEEQKTTKVAKGEIAPYMLAVSFSLANLIVIAMLYYEIFDYDVSMALWVSGGIFIASIITVYRAKKKLNKN